MSKPKHVFSFEKPEESPGYLLWQVSNLWQRKMKEGLSAFGLTHVQFVLLAAAHWLASHEDTVMQQEIAAHAKTDKMMTSKVLRTLEKKKLLIRNEHPTDTRAKIIALTEEGVQLLTKAVRKVEQIDQLFFEGVDQRANSFADGLRWLMVAHQPSPGTAEK